MSVATAAFVPKDLYYVFAAASSIWLIRPSPLWLDAILLAGLQPLIAAMKPPVAHDVGKAGHPLDVIEIRGVGSTSTAPGLTKTAMEVDYPAPLEAVAALQLVHRYKGIAVLMQLA
jgi:hypothetical protein